MDFDYDINHSPNQLQFLFKCAIEFKSAKLQGNSVQIEIFNFFETRGGGLKGAELEPVVGDYLGGTGGGALEAFSAGIGETFMFAPCVESA